MHAGKPEIVAAASASAKLSLDFNGKTYDFRISGAGKLSIGGKQLIMTPSTNTKYSASAGYKMFVYQGITWCFKVAGGVNLVPVMKQATKFQYKIGSKTYTFTLTADGKLL